MRMKQRIPILLVVTAVASITICDSVVAAAATTKNERRSLEWMGYRSIRPQPRIVNGDSVRSPDRFPYYVALVDDRERIVCGGTLIASNVVLTAAHCGMTELKYAVVGKYTSQLDSTSEERIQIAKTHTNPSFTLRDRSHDQMLIELSTPSNNGTLAKLRFDRVINDGDDTRITVIGLGQTYTSTDPTVEPPQVLQQVEMGIVSNAECQAMYDEYDYFTPSISDDMICLMEPSKGQCYGDSGGPYLILGDSPENDLQIGTVAWGIDCASSQYPAVGIRTTSSSSNEEEDDGTSFLRTKTCEIAIHPPTYFSCGGSQTEQEIPSSDQPSNAPSTSASSSSSAMTCIEKPNRCDITLDSCCGTATCQSGFCRTLPTFTTKDTLKVAGKQSFGGGIRGTAANGYDSSSTIAEQEP